MDPAKLKVVELRAELAKRGLDQKGVKAVLVARLQEALDNEEKEEEEEEQEQGEEEVPDQPEEQEVSESAEPKSDPIGQDEASAQSVQSSEPDVARAEEDSSQFVSYQEESESKLESEVIEDSVIQAPSESSNVSSDLPVGEQSASKPTNEASGDSSDQIAMQTASVADAADELNSEPDASKQEEDSKDNFQSYEDSSEFLQDGSSKNNYEEQPDESMDTWNQGETNQHGEEESEKSFKLQDSSFHLDDSNAQDALETRQKLPDSEDSKADVKNFSMCNQNQEIKMEVEDVKPVVKEEGQERQTIKQEPGNEEASADAQNEDNERKRKNENERERKNRWDDNRTETKKRPRSPSEKRRWSPQRKPDDEPEYDESKVLLSWYDSDLHLIINKDNFFSATPISHSGFGYVWAGARASYGFEKGKVYYEVRITENLKIPYLEDEPNPNVLRVGWSIQKASLQLGEEPLTYGFGGTGKISTNCKFQNYGKAFLINDVVGCYLNMDSNPIEISFTINGEYQGVAYCVDQQELKGQALFPHILSKNCSFEVNFGAHDPWAQSLPDFTVVGKVPVEDRISGPKRPLKREDCEVIMMCGLPACGKTTWATKYAEEHKDKMYNVLGTNALIDKMKVMGLPRRRNYSGRWEGLIAKCTKCLNSLLEIAAYRRRNYIIDQTNVYPSAQRRKMRGFEGFVRRAVVIVPTDEELKARTAKLEAEEGKDVPDSVVLEMKANFALPEKGDIFQDIVYTELQEEEARALVAKYNKEGNDAGYFSNAQQPKRFRMDDGRDRRDFRGGNGDSGDRGRQDNRGRMEGRGSEPWRDRGFMNNRRRPDNRGGWGGGPPRQGGWRDNRGGGGGWRGGPPQNRFNDRGGPGPRDMRDRGRDFRDRRDSSGKPPDRRGDRDDKSRPKPMTQGQGQGWGNQAQSGYNQAAGWGQNYANQGWGNWNQGYNQQQWKGYGQGTQQQPQQQTWGQQGWGNQGWGNAGWNQQYYNQYQQNWAQQQQQPGTGTGTTDSSQSGNTDTTAMAAAYASYGQTGAQPTGSWAGYTTVGSTGYASLGSNTSAGTGQPSGTTAASYSTTQKQYRQDPRKAT